MSNELTVVGSIGEINLNHKGKNLILEIKNCNDSEYDSFITFENTCKIYYCKFVTLANDPTQESESNSNDDNKTKIRVLLWKTFISPFVVKGLFLSKTCLWVVGQHYFVDIKQYVENIIETERNRKNSNLKEDSMDIDADEEFSIEDFESVIKISPTNKHKLPRKTACYKCNLIDDSIVTCAKDLVSKCWKLNIARHGSNLSDIKFIPLPDLPIMYDVVNVDPCTKEILNSNPVLAFMYRSIQGPEKTTSILHKLLSTDPNSSNCICVIGHPDGNILYFFCSAHGVKAQVEKLCHIKQPVVGVTHYVEKMKGLGGNGCILIVGSLGKLVFISTDKLQANSEVIKIKTVTLYSSSLNLPSSPYKHVVCQNCIFYISSNGHLWVCKISCEMIKGNSKKMNISPFLLLQRIADFVLLDELKGLLLVVTMSGDLNVCKYEENKCTKIESLPYLMNEIMHQSTVLKNMAEIASYQHQFFAALSTFATLKQASHARNAACWKGPEKWDVSCSVTEINKSVKRFIVSVNFKCSEKLNPEFWSVTASLYSHFQKNSALVSKTMPFNSDASFNIEVQESFLCPSHAAPFPIYVEVGLLLSIPEKLKTMSCFHLVLKELPMYLRIRTFILNELYFMKHRPLNSPQSQINSTVESRSVALNIQKMSMDRPISKLFDIKQMFVSSPYRMVTFRLLTTSAQEMANSNSTGQALSSEIFQLLLQKSHLNLVSEDSTLTCMNQPVNMTVSAHESTVCITIHTDSFPLLNGIRMAVMEFLLSKQKKLVCQPSQYVSIPAAINKTCEQISKDLLTMLNEDMKAEEFQRKIMFVYKELRSKVSGILPFS